MSKNLKDALMQAGFTSTKSQNERTSKKGRVVNQAEKHQETRNFCEECELIHPDVERYKHRNPTTEAQWICLACVDKLEIHDKFRVTHQSHFAKQGRFLREFGPTRGKEEFAQKSFKGDGAKRGDRNGNQQRNDRGPRKPGQNDKRRGGHNRNDRN